MDYEFLRDVTGQVIVRFSMGHEAMGHWINEELNGDFNLLDRIEDAAVAVKGSECPWLLAGHEYTLLMDSEEVMICANRLAFAGDEMEEGMNYYDQESRACCGIEDFLLVLKNYRSFIVKYSA